VLYILSHKSDCSEWFYGAGEKVHMGPTSTFNNTPIFGKMDEASNMADVSTAFFGAINVNYNGAFFSGVHPPVGGMYAPGSTPAQITILLHELAHKLFAIPHDGFDSLQSEKNTDTVLSHCAAAINGD